MNAPNQGPNRPLSKVPYFTTPAGQPPPPTDGIDTNRPWIPHAPAVPTDRTPGQPGATPAERPADNGRPSAQRAATGDLDWSLVRTFRAKVTKTSARNLKPTATDDQRKQATKAFIADELREHASRTAAGLLEGSQPAWTPALELAYARAIYDSIFGFGRLQPLLNDKRVENIEIYGCDNVKLIYGDGTIHDADPIADSDEELIDDIRAIATQGQGGERAFTPAHPEVNVSLDNRFRLHAMGFGLTPRPTVTIRQHGHIDVTLDHLVQMDMLGEGLAQFLTAAVRAHRSIMVAGSQGAGKTTLLRALANAIPPHERIGTIESEYELLLHTLPERHSRIVAMQARQGGGLLAQDGTIAGEVTIDALLTGSFRQNLSRIIVGEVRGPELYAMFQAMTASSGSLSTIHAKGAREAIQRMITLAAQRGGDTTLAERTVAENIDLIVFIDKVDLSWKGEPIRRQVADVLQLQQGENNRTAITHLFTPDDTGRARFSGLHPSFLPDLERAGYRPGEWGWTA